MNRVKDVSASSAYAILKKGAVLLDVRQPGEIESKAFDVPDQLHIPLGRLEQRLDEIPKDRKVIVACHSGNRSLVAARVLMNQGYQKVQNLQHGILMWEREGLPIRVGSKQGMFSRIQQMFSGQS